MNNTKADFDAAFAARVSRHPAARYIPKRIENAITDRILADESLRRRLTPPTLDAEREIGEVLRDAGERYVSEQVMTTDNLAAEVLKSYGARCDNPH